MDQRENTKKTGTETHEEQVDKIDRLSDLPDSIILHILSLKETKFAVRTYVLSKKWKLMWTSLPDLHLRIDRNEVWFTKFVRQLFARRNDIPLNKFSFYHYRYNPKYDKSMAEGLANYAVAHGVQHLIIGLDFVPLSFLSPVLSRCQSLRTLELSSFEEAAVVDSFSPLSLLTTLNLWGCSFSAYPMSLDPFARLVNLKDLRRTCCGFKGFFQISGPQLDSLTSKSFFTFAEGRVEIVAPSFHLSVIKIGGLGWNP